MNALFATAGNVRLWKFIAGLFLLAGCLALAERIWTLSADLYARKTWPPAKGKIISASQQDDKDPSRRAASARGRTRYWVEYQVAFAVPAEQCRTGLSTKVRPKTCHATGLSTRAARNQLAGSSIGFCTGIMRTNRLSCCGILREAGAPISLIAPY